MSSRSTKSRNAPQSGTNSDKATSKKIKTRVHSAAAAAPNLIQDGSTSSLHRAEPAVCNIVPASSEPALADLSLLSSGRARDAASDSVLIEVKSNISDVCLPDSGAGLVTGLTAVGRVSPSLKEAIRGMDSQTAHGTSRGPRSTKTEPLLRKALTQSAAVAAVQDVADEGHLVRLRRDSVAGTEDEWSDLDSASVCSGRSSILPASVKGPTLNMEQAALRANQLLQAGKEALENAGNMKRECKATATDSIQQLYEIVLALSDSRSRHMVNLEQERRRSAKELVRIERLHNKQILEIQRNHTKKIEDLLLKQDQSLKISESIWTWLNFELDGPIKSISTFETRLHKIQESLAVVNKPDPPKERQETKTVELDELINRMTTLREDTINIQASLSSLMRVAQERPIRMPDSPRATLPPVVPQTQSQDSTQWELVLEGMETLRTGIEQLRNTGIKREEIQADLIEAVKPIKIQLRGIAEELKDSQQEVMAAGNHRKETSVIGSELAWEEVKGRLSEIESAVQQAVSTRVLSSGAENLIDGRPTLVNRAAVQQAAQASLTYAQTVAKPRYSMVLESADPRKTGDDIIKDVKGLNVIDLGVGIHKVAKIRNHRVVVSCNTGEGREKLKKAIEGKCKQISATQSSEKLPLIKLKGVTNELKNADIEKAIISQNRLLSDLDTQEKQVRVVRRAKARTRELCNPILEVSAAAWNRLVGKKLHIGLQSVWVDDQSPIMQCYRCMGFNHRASDCKSPEICGHCGEAHDTRSCKKREETAKCANCRAAHKTDLAHPAYSQSCPEWIKWDRIARSSVAYC